MIVPAWVLALTDDELRRRATPAAVTKGRTYARDGAVRALEARPDGALQADVVGSGPVYRTVVRPGSRGGWSGDCSCPVGFDCKHCVATLLVARGTPPPAPPRPKRWQTALAGLLEAPDDAGAPALGLVVDLERGQVRLRPVRDSGGRWVRSRATWRDLTSLYGHTRSRDAHRAALVRLHTAWKATQPPWAHGTDSWIWLHDVGPQAFALLGAVEQAGVVLLDDDGQPTVTLSDEPARLVVDVDDHDGQLRLEVRVEPRGALLVGSSGAVLERPEGLLLLPLAQRVEAVEAALLAASPLVVPREDVPQFVARYYPRLRRRLEVRSGLGLPDVGPPRLHLHVAFSSGHRADLRWSFAYPVGDDVVRAPLSGPAEVDRDDDAERALLAALPAAPVQGGLEGLDTARFVTDVLPALQGLVEVGLDVDVEGEPGAYDHTDAAPVVAVSALDRAGERDWFDLGVKVTVAGEVVPLGLLLSAVTTGEAHLLLDSGTWFDLDRPELLALRDLLEEARGLADPVSGTLRVSAYQAGLWDELVALGVVGEQSARWRQTVGRLLDVPPPPPVPASLRAELRPYQREGYGWLSTVWDLGLGGVLADDMGLGKGLAHGSRVLALHGWLKVEDVRVGDRIIGRDGCDHAVTGVYDRGVLPTYRVRFNDGAYVIVDGDHLWSVQHVQNGRRHPEQWRTVQTRDLVGDLVDAAGTRKWRVPMVDPVQHPAPELPLDPYLLGVLLGDGCLRQGSVMVSSADHDLLDALVLPEGIRLVHAGAYDYRLSGARRGRRNAVIDALRDLGLWGVGSHTKFVPELYLRGGADQRLALLRGLMDTDGSAGTDGTNEFTSVSKSLADDVAELAESLGGTARRGIKRLPGGGTAWRVNVKLRVCPFLLARKARAWRAPTKYPPGRIIVSIESVGQQPVTCLAVDAPDRLFVTEHHVVTHNTVQVLALAARLSEQGALTEPLLVVAPSSVVPVWAAEAARFCPTLPVAVVGRKAGAHLAERTAGAAVVVTSYAVLRLDDDAFLARRWGGLVLDEAQTVKNSRSKAYATVRRVDAPVKLAVTGTPLENSLADLWALLSVVAPGLFPDPKAFGEVWRRPIESGEDPARLEALRRRVAPLLLRRTKEQVAADLPPKVEQTVTVALAPAHRRLYDAHLQRERQRVLGLLEDLPRNRFAVLRSLTLLRQLSLDAALVDPAHDAVVSAKTDELVARLHEVAAEGHRALVFSSFTGYLARVRARLDAEGLGHCYLDGRTRDRAKRVQAFRDGTAPAFLISLKAGGTGLTLTEADYVFVLDPWWNPAAEAQAVDRAHRIGQTRTVVVYRLVSADTVEQKVVALQERKRDLFAAVVEGTAEGDGAGGGALTAEDLRALLG